MAWLITTLIDTYFGNYNSDYDVYIGNYDDPDDDVYIRDDDPDDDDVYIIEMMILMMMMYI